MLTYLKEVKHQWLHKSGARVGWTLRCASRCQMKAEGSAESLSGHCRLSARPLQLLSSLWDCLGTSALSQGTSFMASQGCPHSPPRQTACLELHLRTYFPQSLTMKQALQCDVLYIVGLWKVPSLTYFPLCFVF